MQKLPSGNKNKKTGKNKMAILPPNEQTTVQKIYRHHESKADQGHRNHLGASIIGRECERAVWYSYHWYGKEEHTGQRLRLFETGDLAEHRFVAELRAIGVEVHEIDERTGKQYRVQAHGGHLGGSLDGVAKGLPECPSKWHVLEFKTHNEKSFKELEKVGVEKAKPEHFAQMQIYMGLTGIDRAFYMAVNKNTDELHGERVKFKQTLFDALMDKAGRIIYATKPPVRLSERSSFYKCKWCPFAGVCHGGSEPERNCRTCRFSKPVEGGEWLCEVTGTNLNVEQQLKGCDKWEMR